MSATEGATLAMALGLAVLGSWAAGWLMRAVAWRTGWLDVPDGQRKRHQAPVALLGGVAIFSGTVSGLAAVAAHNGWMWGEAERLWGTILLSALMLLVVGLFDDRWGLRPRWKLILQVLAVAPYALLGRSIDSLHVAGLSAELGWLAVPCTILWLVVCCNVVNLLDGADGVAGLFGLVTSTSIALLAWWFDRTGVLVASLILAGALTGFLVHNWPPARLYMGDAGSLPVGFVLGALAIDASFKSATGWIVAGAVALLGIPLLDTLAAILRRLLQGRPIAEPDRGHIHHRLQDRGLTPGQTLLVLAGLTVVLAGAGMVSVLLDSDWLGLAACALLTLALVAGRVFGDYEVGLAVRWLIQLGDTLRRLSADLRWRMATVAARDAERLWQELCHAARDSGLQSLLLQVGSSTSAGMVTVRQWNRALQRGGEDGCWEVELVIQRRSGPSVRLLARANGLEHAELAASTVVPWMVVVGRAWPVEAWNWPEGTPPSPAREAVRQEVRRAA